MLDITDGLGRTIKSGLTHDEVDVYFNNIIKQFNNMNKKNTLKPHPDYDFIDEDKVFLENSDGSFDYYILHYSQELAAWILIPYTNKFYDTLKLGSNGEDPQIDFLYEIGYDLLERVDDFEFDELP